MSAIVAVLCYFAAIGSALVAARDLSAQLQQPWILPAVLAGCCFLTARYVAKGIR